MPAVWRKGRTAETMIGPGAQRPDFLAFREVPASPRVFDALMLAAAREKLALVGVELHMDDGIGVARESVQFLGGRQVPEAD